MHATCATLVRIALRRLVIGVSEYKCIGKSDKKEKWKLKIDCCPEIDSRLILLYIV